MNPPKNVYLKISNHIGASTQDVKVEEHNTYHDNNTPIIVTVTNISHSQINITQDIPIATVVYHKSSAAETKIQHLPKRQSQ